MKKLLNAACITAAALCLTPSPSQAATSIQFDYSLDSNSFFAAQARKDALEAAADVFEVFLDDLDAITPGGPNSWSASITHPGTSSSHSIANLSIPADTLIFFAGGRDLPGATLGRGGPGGFSVGGTADFVSTVATRGEIGASGPMPTDFGPWGGAITFDTTDNDTGLDRNWNFDVLNGPGASEDDFLSVAIHELAHALGFGTTGSWSTHVNAVNGLFLGPDSALANNNTAPGLDGATAFGHWEDGTLDFVSGNETAMDPSLTRGTRKLFTALDYAGMSDVGWEVPEPTTFVFLGLGALLALSRAPSRRAQTRQPSDNPLLL